MKINFVQCLYLCIIICTEIKKKKNKPSAYWLIAWIFEIWILCKEDEEQYGQCFSCQIAFGNVLSFAGIQTDKTEIFSRLKLIFHRLILVRNEHEARSALALVRTWLSLGHVFSHTRKSVINQRSRMSRLTRFDTSTDGLFNLCEAARERDKKCNMTW